MFDIHFVFLCEMSFRPICCFLFICVITRTTLASAGISCRRMSVYLSVTSRCSTETAKHWIMLTMPHDNMGTLVLRRRKSRQNSNGITPNEGAKCRRGRLNTGAVAENWRLSTRSVVNVARSQVHHTERPPYLSAARSL